MMTQIMAVLDCLFQWMITCASGIVSMIVNQPLLLCFVVLGFVGIGVGLIRRLIRL